MEEMEGDGWRLTPTKLYDETKRNKTINVSKIFLKENHEFGYGNAIENI